MVAKLASFYASGYYLPSYHRATNFEVLEFDGRVHFNSNASDYNKYLISLLFRSMLVHYL